MSRVGQAPIALPEGVQVSITGRLITVNGPRGELQRAIPQGIRIERADNELRVLRGDDERESRALHGLIRSLVANMVGGVTRGYQKNLQIQGDFDVPTPTSIVVRGIDKELVGQTAAEIRAIRRPEPYKAKGIRYEGEHIRRKAGKAAKTGG